MSVEPIDFSRRQAPQPRLSAPYVPGHRHARFWRREEDAVLQEYFLTGGAAAVAEKLPQRSLTSIYQRARTLGVRFAPVGPVKRRPHSPELDAKIREAWPGLTSRGSVRAFADSVGVDRWVITHRATAMGLTRAHRIKEANWTAAEIALLGKVPLDRPNKASAVFAEHGFRRSPTAIVVRATRLGISRRRADAFTARQAAKVLGVDDKWVTSRCIDGRIEAEKRGTQRRTQQGGDVWLVTAAALRAFVIEQLQEVDIRKVDKFAFVALLTDPEAGPRYVARTLAEEGL